jgi:hypothetical protein
LLVDGQWKDYKDFCKTQGPLTSKLVSLVTVKLRLIRTENSGSLELTLMPEKRLEVKLNDLLLQFNKFKTTSRLLG